MIAVIVAMEVEKQAIVDLLEDKETIVVKNKEYTTGKINGKEIIVSLCGIGKVASSISAVSLIENFPIELVINIGTAGGIKEYENVGDILIADKLTYHDFDTTALDDYTLGFKENMYVFESDNDLIEKAKKVLANDSYQVFVGHLVSGDCFVSSKEKVEFIQKYYPEALGCEMEATSIAHVCSVYNYPFLIIRSFSDIVIKENNNVDFETYKQLASSRAANFLYSFCCL